MVLGKMALWNRPERAQSEVYADKSFWSPESQHNAFIEFPCFIAF